MLCHKKQKIFQYNPKQEFQCLLKIRKIIFQNHYLYQLLLFTVLANDNTYYIY